MARAEQNQGYQGQNTDLELIDDFALAAHAWKLPEGQWEQIPARLELVCKYARDRHVFLQDYPDLTEKDTRDIHHDLIRLVHALAAQTPPLDDALQDSPSSIPDTFSEKISSIHAVNKRKEVASENILLGTWKLARAAGIGMVVIGSLAFASGKWGEAHPDQLYIVQALKGLTLMNARGDNFPIPHTLYSWFINTSEDHLYFYRGGPTVTRTDAYGNAPKDITFAQVLPKDTFAAWVMDVKTQGGKISQALLNTASYPYGYPSRWKVQLYTMDNGKENIITIPHESLISQDGKTILFDTYDGIYQVLPDGSSERVAAGKNTHLTDIRPDGNAFLYTEDIPIRGKLVEQIREGRFERDTQKVTKVEISHDEFNYDSATYSPDGERITGFVEIAGQNRVFFSDKDTFNPVVLKPDVRLAFQTKPHWGDNETLMFVLSAHSSHGSVLASVRISHPDNIFYFGNCPNIPPFPATPAPPTLTETLRKHIGVDDSLCFAGFFVPEDAIQPVQNTPAE